MGALAADSNWTKEDDFRLRKAAETGISLESLARGGIQLSKQFTIQQLQDRWLAILYNPIISAESSARTLEFEHSDSPPIIEKSPNLGNIHENKYLPITGKRKPESIRKRFYAMRKKLNLQDLDFNNENNEPAGFLTYENAESNEINLDVFDHQDYNEDDIFIDPVEDSDEFKEIIDLLDVEGPELPPIIDQSCIIENSEMENQICGENLTANSYLMELSNTLLDITMDDDDDDINIPIMDANGNQIDKFDIDGYSSFLLDSPKRDEFLDNNCQETNSFDGLLLLVPQSKPLTSVIICTLNTEDPEIPSNDDVFLLNLVPSTSQEMQMEAFKIKPQPKRAFRVPKPIIQKENKFQKSQFCSPIIGSQFRSEIQGVSKVKQGFCNNGGQEQTLIRPEVVSENVVTVKSEIKTNGTDLFTNCGQFDPMATVQQEEKIHLEVINPVLETNEEPILSQSDDNENDDDDIPNFSDVEALILDEDPSLDEQHLHLYGIGSSDLLQTFKYENAQSQKRIIRLQQAADAFMKRDMTSRGAFAILQGWHMKFYVKKPEVLIGRATEEFKVDIDLGREGQNSRVSRRQAIINMDREGSFHMRNLSKYSIFVNCVELATNQSMTLTSSCLIEIKGMGFLFETNEVCIKQYVDSVKNKTVMEDKS